MPYRMITESHFNKGMRDGTVIVEAANAGLTTGGIGNDGAASAEDAAFPSSQSSSPSLL